MVQIFPIGEHLAWEEIFLFKIPHCYTKAGSLVNKLLASIVESATEDHHEYTE